MSHNAFSPPRRWRDTLECIRKMRASKSAPVDSMGCHRCFDPVVDDKTRRFQILTKDDITHGAMARLRTRGLSIDLINQIELSELQELLYPVGFYKKKAIFLKKVAQILLKDYEGDIPKDPASLIRLPGVGPKMAYLAMNVAWHDVCGIGVDTHVHRICKRIEWVPYDSKSPELTRKTLESWFPREYWADINELLVGFGQEICTPVKPKCSNCLLSDICPFARKNPSNKPV